MCGERHIQQPIYTTFTLVASALANGSPRSAHCQRHEARKKQTLAHAPCAERRALVPKVALPYQPAPLAPRSRNALAMTDTELRLMASAAMSGDSNKPVNGNSTPAATGTPSEL